MKGLLALFAWTLSAAEPNTLTSEERAAGWRLLFDGRTMAGWEDPAQRRPAGDSWRVMDGCLMSVKQPRILEDLVTREAFENFEFRFEWQLEPGGNSGIKYHPFASTFFVQTKPGWLDGVRGDRGSLRADQRGQTYWTAFELQLIDPAHADAKRGEDRQAGALYSIAAPIETAKLAPPGEWNQGGLVVSSARVEHWVNGVRLVSVDLAAPEFREKLRERYGRRGSTFWAKLEEQLRKPTPIALQNHADSVVRFRNLRIRNSPNP